LGSQKTDHKGQLNGN